MDKRVIVVRKGFTEAGTARFEQEQSHLDDPGNSVFPRGMVFVKKQTFEELGSPAALLVTLTPVPLEISGSDYADIIRGFEDALAEGAAAERTTWP